MNVDRIGNITWNGKQSDALLTLRGYDPDHSRAASFIDHPARRIDDLLPWNWTQHQPLQIAAWHTGGTATAAFTAGVPENGYPSDQYKIGDELPGDSFSLSRLVKDFSA